MLTQLFKFTILHFQQFLTRRYPSRLFEFIKDHLIHGSIKNVMMQNVSKGNLNVDTRRTNVKLIWKPGSIRNRYTEGYVDRRKKSIGKQNSWTPKANHQTLGSSLIKFQKEEKNLLLTSMLKSIILPY